MRFKSNHLLAAVLTSVAVTALASPGNSGKRTSPHGQVVELQTDLTNLVGQLGVRAEDLGLVQTIDLGSPGSWSSGLIGPANHKNFYLSPVAVKGIPGTLHITYGSDRLVTAEECPGIASTGKCVAAKVQQNGSTFQLALGDSQWELDLSGSPCIDGTACDFYLPSWLLANRAANPAMGDALFPRVVTVVEVKGKSICFAAADSAALYLCVGEPDLGGLQRVEGASSGLFALIFDSGTLALDFAADRAWIASKDALAPGRAALARTADSGFSNPMAFANAGMVRAVNSDVIIWENGYLADWRQLLSLASAGPAGLALSPVPGAVVEARTINERGGAAPPVVAALIGVDNQWQQATYAAHDWTLGDAVPALGLSAPNGVTFTQSSLISIRDTGDQVIAKGQLSPVSLPVGANILQDGSAFMVAPGEPCRNVHYLQLAGEPAAFAESGLIVPCSPTLSYDLGIDRIVVTSRAGLIATSYILAR